MSGKNLERRDFLKSLLGMISMTTLDWSSVPRGTSADTGKNQFDAVIIGSGLGGLSCAAAFARQGFKPLVIEQHNRPGGYATTFKRPGGFEFDVSLHSTTVSERDGLHNLIPGFPEITDIEYLAHPNLYRVIYPDYDITVQQKDAAGYIKILISHFPQEEAGIRGIIEDMEGLAADISRLTNLKGRPDMSRFPVDYPYLFKCNNKTWGKLLDARIKSPKLKALISSQWGYYGLPPSQLSSFYYALPAIDYLKEGGFYPHGRSQKISNELVNYIEEHGGKVLLKTRVNKILVKDQTAYGVKTADGEEFSAKVVISNANAPDTFNRMLEEKEFLKEYLAQFKEFSVSLSSFQVFLGLKEDIIKKAGIVDSEIFYESGYDMDEAYKNLQNADVTNCGFGLTMYDNIYNDYSPEGKNTLNIFTLQGYDHWQKYEKDYLNGNKTEYRKEKERMAYILIKRVEESVLPGLTKAIEVKEIGTPLTNIRYTSNYRGAIYGWNQTLNNSGRTRLAHDTPIKNLYLSGAWTKPGHGYSAVLMSGLQCFGRIMKNWKE